MCLQSSKRSPHCSSEHLSFFISIFMNLYFSTFLLYMVIVLKNSNSLREKMLVGYKLHCMYLPSIIFFSSSTDVVSFASVKIVSFFRLIIRNTSWNHAVKTLSQFLWAFNVPKYHLVRKVWNYKSTTMLSHSNHRMSYW